MRVLGLIVEYNPFHNGHLYHLRESQKKVQPDFTLAVMSGNFVQRGEPALVNKWARAEMALKAGVDLVLELPFVFATASAMHFAQGAVSILHQTGVVTHLCFGSEAGSLELLEKVVPVLNEEPPPFREKLKTFLKEGLSLPAARAKALTSLWPDGEEREKLISLLKSPNNILAIEYLRALHHLKSPIIPLTIPRLKAGYYDLLPVDGIASATALRHLWEKEKGVLPSPSLQNLIPASTWHILRREAEAGRAPVFPEKLAPLILSRLRLTPAEELSSLPDMEPGLEKRLKNAASHATTYRELVALARSRRYPATRIQRLLLHLLFSLKNEEAIQFYQSGPLYLRVLGFNQKGQKLLKVIRAKSSLPLLQMIDRRHRLTPYWSMLRYDVMATDLYNLLLPQPAKGGNDFTRPPVIVA